MTTRRTKPSYHSSFCRPSAVPASVLQSTAAIFLQDQETFQRQMLGVMDRTRLQQHPGGAQKSTLQNTSNIVQPTSMTYRKHGLGRYHTLCCATRAPNPECLSEPATSSTASALVVINSDDDSERSCRRGLSTRCTARIASCRLGILPSWQIALEFLMKYDECAILTCTNCKEIPEIYCDAIRSLPAAELVKSNPWRT